MAIATTNPATGETVREFDALSESQPEDKLQRSRETFATYRDTTFEQRAGWSLRAVALVFRARDVDDAVAIANDSPFGGAKNSGYGRDLASFGPQSSVNAKTIWIQ